MNGRVRVRRTLRASLPGTGSVEAWLVHLVQRSADEGGLGGAAAVVVRAGAVELVDVTLDQEPRIDREALLIGLTGADGEHGAVEAVGVIGKVIRRGRRGEIAVALVFLEWEDNRWWCWEAPIAGDGTLREGGALVRSAVDGDALLPGLGRWWCRARRSGLKVRLEPVVTGDAVVH